MQNKTSLQSLLQHLDVFFILVAALLSTVAADGATVFPPSCIAIQTAINSLPPVGGEVIIQPGAYTCATAVVIDRNNVQVRGVGYPRLVLARNANSPVLVVGNINTPPAISRGNIELSNLNIDGNRLNQTQECWTGPCDTGGLTFIRNSGIVLRRVNNVTIRDVIVQNARSAGLVSERVSQNVKVDKLTAVNNQYDGLAAYQTELSVFTNLSLYQNLASGLSFDLGFNRNVISDSIIAGNGTSGIFLRHSRDNIFQGLQIQRSGEHGVFLAKNIATGGSAVGNTFTGLVIANSGVAPAPAPPGAGIRLNDSSCVNNMIIGSQLIANEAGGISEVIAGLMSVFGTKIR